MVNLDRHLLPFPLVLVNEMQNERTSVSSRIVLFGFFAIFSLHFKTEHTEICSFEKKRTDKHVIGSSKEAANLNYQLCVVSLRQIHLRNMYGRCVCVTNLLLALF